MPNLRSPRRENPRCSFGAMIQAFHAGAYRYWVQHDAPPRWHPWRWIKALLLTTQGQLATVTAKDVP